jgi:methylmalonyl-CoA mutase N-terminal domain/subunit
MNLTKVATQSKPGEYPFLRGVHSEMYRRKLWTMRQYSGFGGPNLTNKRFKKLIQDGGTGLSLAFDLPTQLGLDSDNPLSFGEVGKVGVAVDTVEDIERVFDNIDLEKISASFTINAPAAVILAFYLCTAKRCNADWRKLRGTVQNDILKEYIARGTYIYPLMPSLRLIRDMFAFCNTEVPSFNLISVSGYHMREAGATLEQELAFTLANGRVYVQKLLDAGLDVNTIGRQISFFFSVGNGFFEEIAKFRAARVLWAQIMRGFGADDNASKLRFHCQTAGSTLTAQQPDNNIIRVTLQTLAAVLGGTQSMHANSRDEALGLPTEESAKIALRTQQIIAYESNISNYVDALGGSDLIESLTQKYMDAAKTLFQRIENNGGMTEAVQGGLIKQMIQDAAYRDQGAVERKEKLVVGVNCFEQEEKRSHPVSCIDPAVEREKVDRLRAHKAKRSSEACQQALTALLARARGEENLMPAIIDAADKGATIGEICKTLKDVFGEY